MPDPHVFAVRCASSARASWMFAVLLVLSMVTPSSAQPLAGGWQVANVGGPGIGGTASLACDSNARCAGSLTGSGVDIWGSSDQFTFVNRAMTGDGVIVMRVDSLQGPDAWSKVGLMIRESLAAGSSHGFAFVSNANGVGFHRRQTTNALSVATSGGTGTAPVWLKLERRGTSLIAYRSATASTWTKIGTDTVAMAPTVSVGVAIVSRNNSTVGSASVAALAMLPAVPDGWSTADVGGIAVADANANSHSAGLFAVADVGRDIGDAADQFRFTYRPISGDVDVVARVGSLVGLDTGAKAGLMIRASTASDAAHASTLVSVGQQVVFRRRTAAGALTVDSAAGTGRAPVWLKLEKRGDVISSYRSPDGLTWTFIGEDRLALPAQFFVGLALTSRSTAYPSAATFDGVQVTPVAAANVPPQVVLTAPATGTVLQGTAVSFAATAIDPDGAVAAVDFVVNDTVIQSDSLSPYSATWTPAAPGTYDASAVARDNRGATASSARATLTVSAPPLPSRLIFTPSPDHSTGVDYYVATVASVAVPDVPVATLNLGKPSIVNGEITVDVAGWVSSLSPGLFTVTVSAVGPGGIGISAPSAAFAR